MEARKIPNHDMLVFCYYGIHDEILNRITTYFLMQHNKVVCTQCNHGKNF